MRRALDTRQSLSLFWGRGHEDETRNGKVNSPDKKLESRMIFYFCYFTLVYIIILYSHYKFIIYILQVVCSC